MVLSLLRLQLIRGYCTAAVWIEQRTTRLISWHFCPRSFAGFPLSWQECVSFIIPSLSRWEFLTFTSRMPRVALQTSTSDIACLVFFFKCQAKTRFQSASTWKWAESMIEQWGVLRAQFFFFSFFYIGNCHGACWRTIMLKRFTFSEAWGPNSPWHSQSHASSKHLNFWSFHLLLLLRCSFFCHLFLFRSSVSPCLQSICRGMLWCGTVSSSLVTIISSITCAPDKKLKSQH